MMPMQAQIASLHSQGRGNVGNDFDFN